MLINQIRKLVKLVEESEIDELEVSRWGSRIRIRKNPAPVNSPLSPAGESRPSANPSPAVQEVVLSGAAGRERTTTEEARATPSDTHVVKSPMVGTFYRAASPDAQSFVEPGSKVTIGQTLCIIEAMKLMNEIPSEINGVVSEILVENGEPIEYGQELFLIATQ